MYKKRKKSLQLNTVYNILQQLIHQNYRGLYIRLRHWQGGRKRLPKFKFSAKFPIGLHVILQIQIKKFENDCYIMWKIILTENPSRCNLAPLLK